MLKALNYHVLLVSIVILISGCGYTFQNTGSTLPPDVQKIAIPLSQDDSTEAGLAQSFTDALRDEFDRYGAVVVVDDENEADAILETRIVSLFRNDQSVTSDTESALQLDTVLTVAGVLKRPNGQLLWQNPLIRVAKSYGTQAGVIVTSSTDFAGSSLSAGDLSRLGDREVARGQEQDALESLGEDAARRIYADAVSPDF